MCHSKYGNLVVCGTLISSNQHSNNLSKCYSLSLYNFTFKQHKICLIGNIVSRAPISNLTSGLYCYYVT